MNSILLQFLSWILNTYLWLRSNFLTDSLAQWKRNPERKQQSKYFIKIKMTLEIILLSDALKASFGRKKQCAAVRTIHSLMIDPAQKALHFPTLKQKKYWLNFKNPGIFQHHVIFWFQDKVNSVQDKEYAEYIGHFLLEFFY